MRVVIPVAGAGTRLRPHTHSLPKPLLRVGHKPILAHLLDPVVKLEPEEVIFVIGFRGNQIREYVANNYDFKATFIEQDKLLGLGYALNMAVRDIDSGDLMVILGDTIVECDLGEFVAAGDYVLGVRQVENPQRFGLVTVENGVVVGAEEKPEHPKSNLAIIGLYYFKEVGPLKKALGSHVESGKTTRGEIQLTDALTLMIKDGIKFVPYEVTEWFDCGKKETMLSTNRHLIASLGLKAKVENSAVIDPVFVDPSAKVINSVLGPSVSVAENTVIRNSIVRNSIIGSNTTIENMILEDSLVGNDVTLRGTVEMLDAGDHTDISRG
jgi:glucose-1-phosphate thymidylyltransferase